MLGLVALFAIVGRSSRGQANSGEAKSGFTSPGQTNIHEMKDRFAELNGKALLASSGDERAVKDLADEVFAQFGSADVNDALAVFKDRFVNSEVNYRREGKGGYIGKKASQFSK
jgi:hypothetical protein